MEPFRHYDMEYCHMAYAHELLCENSDCYSKRIPQGAARIGNDQKETGTKIYLSQAWGFSHQFLSGQATLC